MAWYVVVGLLLVVPYPMPIVLGVDGFWMGWVVVMLAVILGVVLGVFGERTDGALDRVERRLERYRDGPGDSRNQPSSAAPPESFLVHGRWRVGYLIGAVAWVLAVAWWPEEVWGGEPPPRVLPLVGLLAFGSLFLAFRAYRRGVGARPAGVTVVNFGRTHHIRWQDLRGISYRDRGFTFGEEAVHALEFLLTSGVTVPATIPSGDRKPGGRLDLLRDRIVAVGEAALPGQFEARRASDGKARVNSVRRRRLESAEVDVAVIIRLSDDRYRYRRVRCSGSDLTGGLAHLFDPEADPLVRGGDPCAPRWVLDRDFGTREDALHAVSRDVLVSLEGWLDEVEFCSWVHGSEFADRVRPEAERVRAWGWVVLGVVAVAVFAAAMYVGNLFDVWVGLDTAQTSGWIAGEAYAFVHFVAAIVLAAWVTVRLAPLISRRNLAAEAAREQRNAGAPESRWGKEDDARALKVPAPAPKTLTVVGRTRYLWLLGWLCGAALWVAFGVWASTDGEVAIAAASVAGGLIHAGVAVRGFQRKIVADPTGVTIHNFIRRVLIPWDELWSIDFEQVDSEAMTAMYYKLRFNRRVTAEVPAGGRKPGEYLYDLRETLMSMKAMYPGGGDSLP